MSVVRLRETDCSRSIGPGPRLFGSVVTFVGLHGPYETTGIWFRGLPSSSRIARTLQDTFVRPCEPRSFANA